MDGEDDSGKKSRKASRGRTRGRGRAKTKGRTKKTVKVMHQRSMNEAFICFPLKYLLALFQIGY